MSARPVLKAGFARMWESLRVVGSFLAAVAVGTLLLLPFIGPFAVIIAFGALLFAFPSLVVAIALRLTFRRSIETNLLAWCLAAPVVAVTAYFAAIYLLDYRQRGFDLVAYLSLPQNLQQGALALFYATLSAAFFYVWERSVLRRDHASS